MNRVREPDTRLQRSEVIPAALPAPDLLEEQLPDGARCLVTGDDGPLSLALAERLTRRGWQVTLLRLPPAVLPEVTGQELPEGLSRIALTSLDESDLQAQLASLSESAGPIRAFVHLHPRYPAGADLFDERERTVVKALFLIAKQLQPLLTQRAEQGRARFLTVTRLDGALGLGGEQDCGITGGGLPGLTKSLALEWENVFCRAVDLDPALEAQEAAALILEEFDDPDRRIREVGRGERGRVTLTTRPTTAAESPPAIETAEPALFLVSGGARGITAACVIELARRRGGTYLLVGRSPHPEGAEPAWSAGATEEPALKKRAMEALQATGEAPTPLKVKRMVKEVLTRREILGTLDAVAEAGGQALYVSADVTDREALQSGIEEGLRRLDPTQRITGIIHGAGLIADKPIEEKTGEDFERVYAVKVDGLRNLLECVDLEALRQLILFSSVAGFYGNVGQTDYALANEVLNKAAHRMRERYPHCHVRAIDWGPWDGGMVTPALKRLLERRQVEVIPIDAGTRLFAGELTRRGKTQIVVGSSLVMPARLPEGDLQTYRLHRTLTLAANPFLRDHVIGGQAVLPTVCAVAWASRAAEQLYPGYRFFRARNYRALKGIVFDATLADDYVLELREISKGAPEIVFEALVLSRSGSDAPRYHYSVEITLRTALPAPPPPIEPNLEESHPFAGADLYTNGTLFHGPAFQGVERILNLGPEGLTMRCKLPEIDPEIQGQFSVHGFNPYVTDVQLQGLLVWAKETYGYGGLPLRIEQGEQYRTLNFDETTYVSLRVQATSKHRLVADVTVHNAQGEVYSRIEGAEITLSPRLNSLFEQKRLGG